MRDMNAIRYIRTKLFKVTQAEFAQCAGVMQSTVSRWESGVAPTLVEMEAIRSSAQQRGIDWNDSYFFEVPPEVVSLESAVSPQDVSSKPREAAE